VKIAGAAAAVAVVGMRPRARFGSPREEGSRRERSVSILEDQKGKEKKKKETENFFYKKHWWQDPRSQGCGCHVSAGLSEARRYSLVDGGGAFWT